MRNISTALRATLLVLGLCMGAAHAQNRQPIKVGMLTPIRTVLGTQAATSAKIAVEMVNSRGGVLGRPLELVIYDDGNSPVTSVAAMQRLLDQDGVKIVVGPYGSTQALATLPVARSKNVLFLPVASKHPGVTATGYDKVFRFNSTVAMDDEVLREYMREKVKPGSIAFLGENNETSRAYLAGLKGYFPQDPDNRIKFVQYFDSGDYSGLITAAKNSQADTVYLAGINVEQYGNVLRTAKDFNYKPKNLVLAPGIVNARAVELAGGGARGAVSTDIYLPTLDTALNKEYVAGYRKAMNNVAPEKLELLWFEGISVLAQAMQQAGTATDLDKIAKVMHDATFKSPRGDLKFDATGQAQSKPFIVQVKDDNTILRVQ